MGNQPYVQVQTVMEDKQEILEAIAKLQINIKEDIKNLKEDMVKQYEETAYDLQQIKTKQEKNDKKIQNLEKEVRRRNIVIYGIEEEENNYFELEKLILNLFTNKLRTTCTQEEIDFVKRLGKKQGNINRPVLVGLTTWGKKIKILKAKKELKGTKIYINEDFPPNILEVRKDLQPILMEKRKNGAKAYLKYDKLVINGIIQNEKDTIDILKKKETTRSVIQSRKRFSQNNAKY